MVHLGMGIVGSHHLGVPSTAAHCQPARDDDGDGGVGSQMGKHAGATAATNVTVRPPVMGWGSTPSTIVVSGVWFGAAGDDHAEAVHEWHQGFEPDHVGHVQLHAG